MRQCNPIALTAVNFVLACGFIVTVFSDLPSLRPFGWLSAFAMLAALAADLLILRPTVRFLSRIARRMGANRFTGNGGIRYLWSLRPGKRDRDFGDLVARGFDGDGLPVTARIDGQTG